MMIQAIFYANPDGYPPIINSTHLLAQAGYRGDILCQDFWSALDVQHFLAVTVRRLTQTRQSNWVAYLAFVKNVWRQEHQ